jgi:predicted transposase YdaD
MEQLPTPHNNFFHFALSHLPNARSLIETQLSEAALAELDLETLQVETGSFIDADLTEKFSDLLMSVQLSRAS